MERGIDPRLPMNPDERMEMEKNMDPEISGSVDVDPEFDPANQDILAIIEIDDEVLNEAARRKESKKLATLSALDNVLKRQEQEDSRFFNMSLFQIGEETSTAFTGIIDDLLKARSFRDVREALFRNDRLVYTGIITVIVAITIGIVVMLTKS